MYNWLIIYTEPDCDKMNTAHFFNRSDVDYWLQEHQDYRAIVIYGRIEDIEDNQ